MTTILIKKRAPPVSAESRQRQVTDELLYTAKGQPSFMNIIEKSRHVGY